MMNLYALTGPAELHLENTGLKAHHVRRYVFNTSACLYDEFTF